MHQEQQQLCYHEVEGLVLWLSSCCLLLAVERCGGRERERELKCEGWK